MKKKKFKHCYSIFIFFVFFLFPASLSRANETAGNNEALISKKDLLKRGYVSHDHFVLNSIPKCGTHFIMECIYYMINKKVDEGYDYIPRQGFTQKKAKVYFNYLKDLKKKHFIHKTHVPYFPEIEKVYLQANCKWIFFIRDPRDALVSLVFYLETMQGNQRDFMRLDSTVYDSLSFDDKIAALMTGSCCTNYLKVWYTPLARWKDSPYGLTIRFEDLAGPYAGGERIKQIESIRKIAQYLNVNLNDQQIEAIAEYMFVDQPPQDSMGHIYKRSQSGSWKTFFSESNKQLFKEVFDNQQLRKYGYEP